MIKPAPASCSYMELCFHIDGEENLYLRVPTIWDDVHKIWRGFIKTPTTKKLIHSEGKDSFELQNSFNRALAPILEKGDALSEEVFSMFKPFSYWEEMSKG